MNDTIVGEIYCIENTTTKKCYVGQTLSHRKNKGKYKPFGYEGRFRDHISEALCNTKKKQCWYLNNAIRSYGKEAFIVKLIVKCSKEDIDTQESHYIKEYNTLYPNGYNLTKGGKTVEHVEISDKITRPEINTARKRGGCLNRAQDTRQKISTECKKAFSHENIRKDLMTRTQSQHYSAKLNGFKGSVIDIDNLDQYIYERKNFIKVKVDKKQTSFVGKFQTIDELKQRARNFLKEVFQSATSSNCSGNP